MMQAKQVAKAWLDKAVPAAKKKTGLQSVRTTTVRAVFT